MRKKKRKEHILQWIKYREVSLDSVALYTNKVPN